jgi:hypothetical protein
VTVSPIVLAVIVSASVSFLVVVLFNLVRESLRLKRMAAHHRSRRNEFWE